MQESFKILIVNATPKTDGITYSFVTTAEQAASQAKIETETIRLSALNLQKCKMCGTGWGICFKEHYCIHGDKDGFNDLQKKLDEAGAVVMVTPVYWGEISEELKIFIDKLRRTQATKQWDSREEEVSFYVGKPSIIVAVAGGGGGGILTALADMERAISQMGGDAWPRENAGIFDYIGVNRWNQEYKREVLEKAVLEMIAIKRGEREVPEQNR